MRVKVDGLPSLQLDLRIGNGPLGEIGGTSGGHLAAAMSAVRAIPDVLDAPPGIVTARVFGAYRWPTEGG